MAQGDGALGSVGWVIVQTDTNEQIGAGTVSVEEGDIVVEEHKTSEGVTYFRKTIRLMGPFKFSIDEHPGRTPSELTGFGLTADNDDLKTFSWEWFNVTGATEATKLQEQGKLRIEVGKTEGGWEVLCTEFLSDVSLRITRFEGDPSKEPFWRVWIRRGSWVAWPAAA